MRALRLRGIIACAAFVAAIMALPQLADARPSRWTAPTARPYIAFAGMPTDTGEEGLMRFQGPYVNDHKSLPLVGLEVG